MTNPSAWLSGDADDVGERLVEVARRERAPNGARERALSRVAAVSLGTAVATTAKAASAAPALGKAAGVLGLKWLAIGLGAALVSLTAVDQVQRALSPAADAGVASTAVVAPVVRGTRDLPTASVASPVAAAPAPVAGVPATPPIVAAPRAATPAPEVPALSAAPSAAAFDAPTVAQLAREVAALRQARAALALGRPGASLETLAAYHREFPLGVLGTEEAALRVEIAFAMGDANAFELARRFLAEHATSPLAARVRALRDAKSAARIKP
jgi:hypothetical protein